MTRDPHVQRLVDRCYRSVAAGLAQHGVPRCPHCRQAIPFGAWCRGCLTGLTDTPVGHEATPENSSATPPFFSQKRNDTNVSNSGTTGAV